MYPALRYDNSHQRIILYIFKTYLVGKTHGNLSKNDKWQIGHTNHMEEIVCVCYIPEKTRRKKTLLTLLHN